MVRPVRPLLPLAAPAFLILSLPVTAVVAQDGDAPPDPPAAAPGDAGESDAGEPDAGEPDADEPASSPDDLSEAPDVVMVDRTVPDGKIRDFLQSLLVKHDGIRIPRVEVEGGFVTLSGEADTDRARQWAGDYARATEGVVAVQNKIAVQKEVSWTRAGQQVVGSVRALWEDFLEQSPLLLVAAVVLVLTAVVARIARAVFARTPGYGRLRSSLQDLIEQFIAAGVWIVGVLVAATVAFPGVTPGSLIATLGLGGVAIGFAFKDIFENFFAGILILWKFPFDRGDFIECEGISGKVQQITVRNTLIRQTDGKLVVAPNAMLFKNPTLVYTNWKSRRVTVTCGVAYAEDVDAAREIIHTAVAGCDTVEQRKPVEIFAKEFADSSVNFEVTWWADPTPLGERKSRDQIVAAVKRALDDAGIEIPFPQRTLWFKEPLQTTREGG